MKQIRKRLTYANVMSSLAVFLILGGATAIAASKIGKKSVGTAQLKANAVTAKKIKKNAITNKKIKNGTITGNKVKNDSLTGTQINESTLGTVPTSNALVGLTRKSVRLTATGGATYEQAQAAAPEVAFFSAGPFTVYAKCFTDDANTETYGIFYIRTSQNGALLDSDQDSWDGDGGEFLDTNTPEEERELVEEEVEENEANYYGEHDPEFAAWGPDGTVLKGLLQVGVKNGTLPGSQGAYGVGNVCLMGGVITTVNG